MRHTGRSRGAREADGPSSEGLPSATIRPRDTPAKSAPLSPPSVPGLLDHSGTPCESLDASENLSKKSRRQVALRQLQDEIPRMSDEAPTGQVSPAYPRPRRSVNFHSSMHEDSRALRPHTSLA